MNHGFAAYKWEIGLLKEASAEHEQPLGRARKTFYPTTFLLLSLPLHLSVQLSPKHSLPHDFHSEIEAWALDSSFCPLPSALSDLAYLIANEFKLKYSLIGQATLSR